MAILRIYPIPEQDQYSVTGPAPGATGTIVSQCVLVYRVQFDPATFSAAQVYNIGFGTSGPDGLGGTLTLPTYLAELGGMFCTKIEPRRKKNHFVDVYCTFVSPAAPTSTGKYNVKIASDYEETTENAPCYGDGTLITNSEGDIYPDGLPKTFYDQKVTVEFDTDAVEATTLSGLHGKVNSDSITMTIDNIPQTFEVNTLKLKCSWKTTYQDTTNNQYAFHVIIILTYRNQYMPGTTTQIGWAKPCVNKGYRRFDLDDIPVMDAALQNYVDLNNKPITTPIFLDTDTGDQIDTTDGQTMAQFWPTTAKLMEATAAFAPALEGITSESIARNLAKQVSNKVVKELPDGK